MKVKIMSAIFKMTGLQLRSRDPGKASNTVPERFFNIRFSKIIFSIKTSVKRLSN